MIKTNSIESIFNYFPEIDSFVGFDLETTGAQSSDRIVEISMVKVSINRNTGLTQTDVMTRIINPEITISPIATEVHGFTNEFVSHYPVFSDLSDEIYNFIKNVDLLVGYNIISFDFPMLLDHFCKVDPEHPFSKKTWKYADAYKIFSEYEKRDLTYALKFYCGETIQNAHSAESDVVASINVFGSQVEMYKQDGLEKLILEGEEPIVSKYFTRSQSGNDWIYNFGKNKGQKVLPSDQYLSWVINNKEFSSIVRSFAIKIKSGIV